MNNILIVEDDSALLESFSEIFLLKGLQFKPVTEIEAALKLIKEHTFNTLISDYHFRDTTSQHLIRTFTEVFPESLVILLSGDSIDEDTYKNFHHNPELIHFMQKPFSLQALLDLLKD